MLSELENHLNEAVEKFDMALQIDPNNLGAYIGKGEVFVKLKRFDEALSIFNDILIKFPNNYLAYFLSGATYVEIADTKKEMDKFEHAIYYIEKALAINPDHIDSRANLIYISARIGNSETLEKEFKSLYKTYPNNRDIIYTYLKIIVEKLNYPKKAEDILDN